MFFDFIDLEFNVLKNITTKNVFTKSFNKKDLFMK